MSFLPNAFTEFVSPECNRFLFLQDYLASCNIPYSVISIENCNHIVIRFNQEYFNQNYKIKTIIAHYDRAVGKDNSYITPGANDNSASVFQLIKLAQKIIHSSKSFKTNFFNIRIIFTDGEELGSAQEQGSFALASLFRKLQLSESDIYVIDGCGRGDVLAVSTTGRSEKANSAFLKKYDFLFNRACKIAQIASRGKFATIPVPYSDNAGFIANGIPAVALTVLPSDEMNDYMRNLKNDRSLLQYVLTNGSIFHEGVSVRLNASNTSELIDVMRKAHIDPAEVLLMSEKLPKTWRMMHTEFDNSANLTGPAFLLMERFLELLTESNIPL